MAACRQCKKTISPTEAKKMHTEKNAKGQLLGLYHNKCWLLIEKRQARKDRGDETKFNAYNVHEQYHNKDDAHDNPGTD